MNRLLSSCAALLLSLVVVAVPNAHAAPQTYVTVFSPEDGVWDEFINTNTFTVFDGTAVDVFSDFNVSSLTVSAAESNGTAAWRDEWTIAGGSGTGSLIVQWRLTGTLVVNAPPPVCTTCLADRATISLASLFGSSAVTSFGSPIIGASQDVPGSQSVQLTGTLVVPFEYGVQFGAGLRMGGGTGDDYYGGGVYFPNGAEITEVQLPPGSVLTTTSGRAYPLSQTPADVISALAIASGTAGLQEGEHLLVNALASLNRENNVATCGQLGAFVNMVRAHAGVRLSTSDANALIASATGVAQSLGCR